MEETTVSSIDKNRVKKETRMINGKKYILEYALQPDQSVLDVLTAAGLVSSKSDGRRMVEQKGVKLDGQALEKFDALFPHPGVLQVGKRRFVRVK